MESEDCHETDASVSIDPARDGRDDLVDLSFGHRRENVPMTADPAVQIADPELRAWLADLAADDSEPSITRLRQHRDRPRGPEIGEVVDFTVSAPSSVPVRVRAYRHTGEANRATCVYVHGGGFVFGDLDSHDRACRRLADLGQIDVVAVDYRRAPEHPAPAAIEDVRTVLAALRNDPERDDLPLGLAGDSAGALIAFLASEASDNAVDRLLMINPNVDLTLSMPSIKTLGSGWGLSSRDLEWFVTQWAPHHEQREHPTLNPLQRPLGTIPMTTIVTSDLDPLRDEGLALGEHLRNAGRLARHDHLNGMVHGVINLDFVSPTARSQGDRILREFAEDLVAAKR